MAARPDVPDSRRSSVLLKREPWEYEADLAKYRAIDQFLRRSGDLSDTSDVFKHYEAQLIALNQVTGYDCTLRLAMYRNYKHTSPDRDRKSRNEGVRLLTQPKMVVYGSDLLTPEVKEQGFWSSVFSGAKRMIGLEPKEQRTVENEPGRY